MLIWYWEQFKTEIAQKELLFNKQANIQLFTRKKAVNRTLGLVLQGILRVLNS